VSPAALYGSFAPGDTTGAYRTGGDILVTKDDDSSEISGTDFALAYVDEIEQSNHPRQRFTVGHWPGNDFTAHSLRRAAFGLVAEQIEHLRESELRSPRY